MTTAINGIPATPGCIVDGHHGMYVPDVLADFADRYGLPAPSPLSDVRVIRKFLHALDQAMPENDGDRCIGILNEMFREAYDELVERIDWNTTGGCLREHEGEVYLVAWLCQECGRHAIDDDGTEPCDHCSDADW